MKEASWPNADVRPEVPGVLLPKGPEAILHEAKQIVFGRGEQEYGHPRDNFQDEADAWSAYLHARGLLSREHRLEPRDIAQLNILQKVIRDGHQPKHDNLLDQIGYTLTAHRIAVEEL